MFYGGLEEIRTPDPHNANVVRSQLRYKPGLLMYKIIFLLAYVVKWIVKKSLAKADFLTKKEPRNHCGFWVLECSER